MQVALAGGEPRVEAAELLRIESHLRKSILMRKIDENYSLLFLVGLKPKT